MVYRFRQPSCLIEGQSIPPGSRPLRTFTLAVLHEAGQIGQTAVDAFLTQGFTARAALDVVLGIGTYTMSTLANRLTGAPLDEPFTAFAWAEPGR